MDASTYRMVVSTQQDYVSTAATADRLVREWLSAKRYDVSALDEGRNDLAPHVRLDHDADSGRRGAYTRWRLRESTSRRGTWESTLIISAGASDCDARTWVQLDTENLPETPGRRPVTSAKPRLADALLEAIDARDGRWADVRPVAAVIGPGEVEEVVEELCDPERRLPVVVASVPYQAEVDAWADRVVDRAFRRLAGLAVLYLLSHQAQPVFNEALEFHPVFGGGIRTYLPGVDPGWRADARRHPVMSRATAEASPRRAQEILAALPRRLAARAPLPPALDGLPAPRLRPRMPAHGSELAKLRAENAELYELLEESEQIATARAQEISALRKELNEANHRGDDLTVDYDSQYAELQQAHRQIRVLQLRLVRAGQTEAAYAPAEQDEGYPSSFAELIDRLGEFSHLVFTGDVKITRELDDQCVSNWVEMAWDGLLALKDFAAAAASGAFCGDFRAWCKNPSANGRTFPPRKAIMTESDAVQNNARWRRQRTFAVPHDVDTSGTTFMGAHLRIGGGNTIAPRLYFHDDTARTGRVYIGYIGPHLTNTRT